jgi:bifunctional UDP-N-acetylglucosamine pyrophosphorylase/glucosamine-1-phosphate N-acetyltransferase
LAFASIELNDPGAYGRVVRAPSGVSIVEAKDYDTMRHGPATGEINAGIYLLRMDAVGPLLPLLRDDNRSGSSTSPTWFFWPERPDGACGP